MTSSEDPRARTAAHPQSAMARIKASCPVCGDVDLTPAHVRLVVCSAPERSFYAFTCTGCRDEVRKPARRDVVDALVMAGVAVEPWVIPAEAMEEHRGSAIGWDDVLDLRLALDGVDALAALLAPPAVHRPS